MVKSATLKDGVLHMEIQTATPRPSKSGKTDVVATSGGNKALPGLTINGKPVIFGFNAYIDK